MFYSSTKECPSCQSTHIFKSNKRLFCLNCAHHITFILPLTKRQTEILDYIISFIQENGYAPTYREIGVAFDIKSTNAISDHLRALKKKGYIESYGAVRVIKILRDSEGHPMVYKLVREE